MSHDRPVVHIHNWDPAFVSSGCCDQCEHVHDWIPDPDTTNHFDCHCGCRKFDNYPDAPTPDPAFEKHSIVHRADHRL